jgi:hypothetical protein
VVDVTRPPPFLRGDGFELTALAADDARLLEGMPYGGQDEILLAARDEAGRLLGIASLGPLDWPRRAATLSWVPSEEARAAAAPVLALVTRYALDELALERIDLPPGAPGEALRALGFAPEPEGGWRLRRRLLGEAASS